MMFRGVEKPTGAIVVEANWRDNPWFTRELEQERLDCLRMQPDQYDHIWEGGYVTAQDGAYFAKCLAVARQENRICHVPRDPLMAAYAFWDIGGTGAKADACSIWMVQFVGKEIRVIDYYEAVGQELSEHVGWLRTNKYDDAKCYLPHDGVKHDSVYRVTYESELKKAGFKVEVMTNAGAGAASQRIEATRRVFPQVWVDKDKCSAGLDALGWYHEKKDDARGIGLGPEHDWSSHGCDAFGAMAVESERLTKVRAKTPRHKPQGGWMGL
jgi:phage terminase large subunit